MDIKEIELIDLTEKEKQAVKILDKKLPCKAYVWLLPWLTLKIRIRGLFN